VLSCFSFNCFRKCWQSLPHISKIYKCLTYYTRNAKAAQAEKIKKVFNELPRCVYQGDLNSSNALHQDGRFAGLIDFNMAGTDVWN